MDEHDEIDNEADANLQLRNLFRTNGSRQQKYNAITPRELFMIQEIATRIITLQSEIALLTLKDGFNEIVYNSGLISIEQYAIGKLETVLLQQLTNTLNSMKEIFTFLTHYQKPPRAPNNRLKKNCRTIVETANHFGNELFKSHFGMKAEEVAEIHNILNIPENINLGGLSKRGKISNDLNNFPNAITTEEALLISLYRLNSRDSLDKMQIHFGRDPALLSEVWTTIKILIADRDYHRLFSVATINERFQDDAIQNCKNSFKQKFEEIRKNRNLPNNCFPESWEDVGLLVDGLRFSHGKPGPNADGENHNVQESNYSGYTKDHNFLYLLVTALNGIPAAIVGPVPGRNTDLTAMNESELSETLLQMGVDCLGDALFPQNTPGIQALPKTDVDIGIPKSVIKIGSSLRVPVEWGVKDLLNRKFLVATEKQQIYRTIPIKSFEYAAIITTLQLCIQGTNEAVYMGLSTPTPEDWFHNGKLL